MIDPNSHVFAPSDWVPNHPTLPVLIYKAAVSEDDVEKADVFRSRFASAGWQGIWHDGIFPYQHYHSGAHEVLGITKGHARLLIGGANGTVVDVAAGDCLVLPAGTGHMRLEATAEFLVIGAYPPGQEPDIVTEAASPEQLDRLRTLDVPASDPLYGADGPLTRLWST